MDLFDCLEISEKETAIRSMTALESIAESLKIIAAPPLIYNSDDGSIKPVPGSWKGAP